jgi:hypothetical protein
MFIIFVIGVGVTVLAIWSASIAVEAGNLDPWATGFLVGMAVTIWAVIAASRIVRQYQYQGTIC